MLEGIDLFKSFIKELLLEGDIVHDDYINHTLYEDIEPKQSYKTEIKLSKTIPNDGKIDIFSSNWSIYRLLRSVDYKPFDIFPALKIEVKDQIY